MQEIHLLILPSWYPSRNRPNSGIFFKEQSESLAQYIKKVSIIYIEHFSIRRFLEWLPLAFRLNIDKENGVNRFIFYLPQIYRLKYFNIYLDRIVFIFLFKIYTAKHGIPDLVHVHSFPAGDCAIWIKKKYHIPFLITEHSSSFLTSSYDNTIIRAAARVFKESAQNFAVSTYFKHKLQDLFHTDFVYMPNFVHRDFLRGFSQRGIITRLLNVGYLRPLKQQHLLITAFYEILKTHPELFLTIVGVGECFALLTDMVEKYRISKKVCLFGEASRSQMFDIYKSHDLLVQTSAFESFGVSYIEAMATGMPVVTTNCGGPSSIITNPELGIVCDNNLKSIIQSIEKALAKKWNNQLIHDYIAKNFSEQRICEDLIDYYNKLLCRTDTQGISL